MRPNDFFAELRRRNVHKVAITYAVISWLLMQIALIPVLAAPGWAIKTSIVLLLLGFIATVFVSWAFEATPDGMTDDEVRINRPATRDRLNCDRHGRRYSADLSRHICS
jgi:uncharacterized membrane protein